jgi:hypothetical protein
VQQPQQQEQQQQQQQVQLVVQQRLLSVQEALHMMVSRWGCAAVKVSHRVAFIQSE